MKIETRDSRTVEVEERALYTFPQGLYGFETCRLFAVLWDEQNPGNPFLWLQSAEEKTISFAVLDAARLFSDYAPPLSPQAARALRLEEGERPRFLVIASVPGPGERLFLNLKCPIALHDAQRLGVQLLLEDDRFPMRYYPPLRREG